MTEMQAVLFRKKPVGLTTFFWFHSFQDYWFGKYQETTVFIHHPQGVFYNSTPCKDPTQYHQTQNCKSLLKIVIAAKLYWLCLNGCIYFKDSTEGYSLHTFLEKLSLRWMFKKESSLAIYTTIESWAIHSIYSLQLPASIESLYALNFGVGLGFCCIDNRQ